MHTMPQVNTDGCDVLIWRDNNDICWCRIAAPEIVYCAPNGDLADVLGAMEPLHVIGIVLDNGTVGKVKPDFMLQN